MGIFSKIKNYITGGAAQVSLVFEKQIVDGSEPIRLFVSATAKDDCKIKSVYLKIRGRETYVKSVSRTTTDSDGNSSTTYVDETHHDNHHLEEKILVEQIELKKGQEEKWLATFELPVSVSATYHGKQVYFKWEVFAGLDMPGNDPDSGWVEFIVSKKMKYSINQV